MMVSVTYLLIATIAVGIGSVLGYIARQTIAKRELNTAEGQVAKLVAEAEKKASDITLEAKSKAVAVLDEAKKELQAREEEFRRQERRIEKREESAEKRIEETEREKHVLIKKAEDIRAIQTEVEKMRGEELTKLENIANLSTEEAQKEVFRLVEEESKDALAKRLSKLEKDGMETLENRALNIMSTIIQKYSRSHVSEFTTTTVQIPSDDIKGKIIGKEGRNIRALEKETGVELIVDDTPESVIISGFDPVRREVAKIALEKLISDGRIHPARIEEAVEEGKRLAAEAA